MVKGLTLSSMLDQQRKMDQNKSDVTIRSDQLMLIDPQHYTGSGKGRDFHLAFSKVPLSSAMSHPFSPWALSQFCSKHHLDQKRWREVEKDGGHSVRITFRDHVNACLASGFGYDLEKCERLIRLYTAKSARGTKSHIRSVLTSKYTRVSNAEILERTQDAADVLDQKGADLRVIQSSHQMDRLIIRIISPKNVQGLRVGVQIKNAEDGSMKIEIHPFTFDSFCENGLVFGLKEGEGGMVRRHIGSTEVLLKHRFNLALAEAFQLSNERTEKFLGLKDKEVQDPLDQIVALCQKNKTKMQVNDTFVKEAQGALPLYQTHHGNNMYSVVSAITQAAQNLEDLDRVRVEQVMGDVVEALQV